MAEPHSEQPRRVVVPPVRARQGTGPRDMVTVLVVSTVLAAAATALLAYLMA
jgi:hypothetical protein